MRFHIIGPFTSISGLDTRIAWEHMRSLLTARQWDCGSAPDESIDFPKYPQPLFLIHHESPRSNPPHEALRPAFGGA